MGWSCLVEPNKQHPYPHAHTCTHAHTHARTHVHALTLTQWRHVLFTSSIIPADIVWILYIWLFPSNSSHRQTTMLIFALSNKDLLLVHLQESIAAEGDESCKLAKLTTSIGFKIHHFCLRLYDFEPKEKKCEICVIWERKRERERICSWIDCLFWSPWYKNEISLSSVSSIHFLLGCTHRGFQPTTTLLGQLKVLWLKLKVSLSTAWWICVRVLELSVYSKEWMS